MSIDEIISNKLARVEKALKNVFSKSHNRVIRYSSPKNILIIMGVVSKFIDLYKKITESGKNLEENPGLFKKYHKAFERWLKDIESKFGGDVDYKKVMEGIVDELKSKDKGAYKLFKLFSSKPAEPAETKQIENSFVDSGEDSLLSGVDLNFDLGSSETKASITGKGKKRIYSNGRKKKKFTDFFRSTKLKFSEEKSRTGGGAEKKGDGKGVSILQFCYDTFRGKSSFGSSYNLLYKVLSDAGKKVISDSLQSIPISSAVSGFMTFKVGITPDGFVLKNVHDNMDGYKKIFSAIQDGFSQVTPDVSGPNIITLGFIARHFVQYKKSIDSNFDSAELLNFSNTVGGSITHFFDSFSKVLDPHKYSQYFTQIVSSLYGGASGRSADSNVTTKFFKDYGKDFAENISLIVKDNYSAVIKSFPEKAGDSEKEESEQKSNKQSSQQKEAIEFFKSLYDNFVSNYRGNSEIFGNVFAAYCTSKLAAEVFRVFIPRYVKYLNLYLLDNIFKGISAMDKKFAETILKNQDGEFRKSVNPNVVALLLSPDENKHLYSSKIMTSILQNLGSPDDIEGFLSSVADKYFTLISNSFNPLLAALNPDVVTVDRIEGSISGIIVPDQLFAAGGDIVRDYVTSVQNALASFSNFRLAHLRLFNYMKKKYGARFSEDSLVTEAYTDIYNKFVTIASNLEGEFILEDLLDKIVDSKKYPTIYSNVRGFLLRELFAQDTQEEVASDDEREELEDYINELAVYTIEDTEDKVVGIIDSLTKEILDNKYLTQDSLNKLRKQIEKTVTSDNKLFKSVQASALREKVSGILQRIFSEVLSSGITLDELIEARNDLEFMVNLSKVVNSEFQKNGIRIAAPVLEIDPDGSIKIEYTEDSSNDSSGDDSSGGDDVSNLFDSGDDSLTAEDVGLGVDDDSEENDSDDYDVEDEQLLIKSLEDGSEFESVDSDVDFSDDDVYDEDVDNQLGNNKSEEDDSEEDDLDNESEDEMKSEFLDAARSMDWESEE
ncbi:MAG: hypothetical protein ABIK31_00345 [candidate division WOR-3 bacterium]